MGSAVLRTVVDPATGREIEIMAVKRNGKVRYQRLASVEERINTPRALENLAVFGELATKAWGRKRTGRLPPANEIIQQERPYIELKAERRARDNSKQRYYQELLGHAVPEVQEELILRQAFALPMLNALAGQSEQGAAASERVLRARLATVRLPYLR